MTQSLLVLLMPQGGQRTARLNAWSGMVTQAGVVRDRQEADSTIDLVAAAARLDAPMTVPAPRQPARTVAAGR